MPIVFNTETKEFYQSPFNIMTLHPKKNKKISWSQRLIDVLQRIDTEFILFALDDFFIKDTVDVKRINKIFEGIKQDQSIGVVYLTPMIQIHTKNDKNILFNGMDGYSERVKTATRLSFLKDIIKPYEKRDMNGLYVVNAQFGIWRKNVLLQTLRSGESAWEWEVYGTIRATSMNCRFISVSYDNKIPIPYDFSRTVLMQGVWLPEHIKPIMEKFDIDLNKRGIKTPDWNYTYNKNIFRKLLTFIKVFRNLLH